MLKKIILPIISLTIIVVCIISWQMKSYSKLDLPYPEPFRSDNPSRCVQSIANEIVNIKNAWNDNNQALLNQEKPTSEMVDEAFEGQRTYRCWLDYLCEAVLYSGTADPQKMQDDESKGVSVGIYLKKLPSCVSADKVIIPGTKLKYMPYCKAEEISKSIVSDAASNYRQCRDLVSAQFTDPDIQAKSSSDTVQKIQKSSAAIVGLERSLKTNSSGQKGLILQNKLSSIVTKLHDMEAHVNQLKEYMQKFDQKLPCYASKCS